MARLLGTRKTCPSVAWRLTGARLGFQGLCPDKERQDLAKRCDNTGSFTKSGGPITEERVFDPCRQGVAGAGEVGKFHVLIWIMAGTIVVLTTT
jgi:hypothetical protein